MSNCHFDDLAYILILKYLKRNLRHKLCMKSCVWMKQNYYHQLLLFLMCAVATYCLIYPIIFTYLEFFAVPTQLEESCINASPNYFISTKVTEYIYDFNLFTYDFLSSRIYRVPVARCKAIIIIFKNNAIQLNQIKSHTGIEKKRLRY